MTLAMANKKFKAQRQRYYSRNKAQIGGRWQQLANATKGGDKPTQQTATTQQSATGTTQRRSYLGGSFVSGGSLNSSSDNTTGETKKKFFVIQAKKPEEHKYDPKTSYSQKPSNVQIQQPSYMTNEQYKMQQQLIFQSYQNYMKSKQEREKK
jgi:hypothetical protein